MNVETFNKRKTKMINEDAFSGLESALNMAKSGEKIEKGLSKQIKQKSTEIVETCQENKSEVFENKEYVQNTIKNLIEKLNGVLCTIEESMMVEAPPSVYMSYAQTSSAILDACSKLIGLDREIAKYEILVKKASAPKTSIAKAQLTNETTTSENGSITSKETKTINFNASDFSNLINGISEGVEE